MNSNISTRILELLIWIHLEILIYDHRNYFGIFTNLNFTNEDKKEMCSKNTKTKEKAENVQLPRGRFSSKIFGLVLGLADFRMIPIAGLLDIFTF